MWTYVKQELLLKNNIKSLIHSLRMRIFSTAVSYFNEPKHLLIVDLNINNFNYNKEGVAPHLSVI